MSALARQSVADGTPAAPTELDATKGSTVLPSSAIYLRFDRFLLPSSISRQSVCLRPAVGAVKSYTDCTGGLTILPSYDPVKREVVLRQQPGARLSLGTTYTVTLFVPTVEGTCDSDIAGSCGIRAFDRATLAEPYTFTFTTTDVDPGTLPDDAAPAPDFCGDKGAATAFLACSYSPCHAESQDGKLGPAEGLDLLDVEGIRGTAINHVAHQTEMGEHADDPEETPARFGRAMPIIQPKSPGDSYLMYKLLVGENLASAKSAFTPSADEIARLRASLVVGMPMPPSEGSSSELDEEFVLNLSAWIAGGAPTPTCQ